MDADIPTTDREKGEGRAEARATPSGHGAEAYGQARAPGPVTTIRSRQLRERAETGEGQPRRSTAARGKVIPPHGPRGGDTSPRVLTADRGASDRKSGESPPDDPECACEQGGEGRNRSELQHGPQTPRRPRAENAGGALQGARPPVNSTGEHRGVPSHDRQGTHCSRYRTAGRARTEPRGAHPQSERTPAVAERDAQRRAEERGRTGTPSILPSRDAAGNG